MEPTLAQIIRGKRAERGDSQEEFAEFIGMSQEWVTKIENGAPITPRTATLQKLSARLDVPIETLYLATNIAKTLAGAKRIAEQTPAIDPNDPREQFIARLRKIEWTDGVQKGLEVALALTTEEQRRRRQ